MWTTEQQQLWLTFSSNWMKRRSSLSLWVCWDKKWKIGLFLPTRDWWMCWVISKILQYTRSSSGTISQYFANLPPPSLSPACYKLEACATSQHCHIDDVSFMWHSFVFCVTTIISRTLLQYSELISIHKTRSIDFRIQNIKYSPCKCRLQHLRHCNIYFQNWTIFLQILFVLHQEVQDIHTRLVDLNCSN